jgi:hypothetical protein
VAVETNAAGVLRLQTEGAISIRLRPVQVPKTQPRRVWLVASTSNLDEPPPAWLKDFALEQDAVYLCEPRGIGGSRWTSKNPPNYVARSHYLLGRTVDSGRVWDLAAAARYLRALHSVPAPVWLAGEGAGAVLLTYAALLEPDAASLVLSQVPATHTESSAPVLLNVLRVCDVPEAVGMLAPRPVTLLGAAPGWAQRPAAIYRAAGVPEKFVEQK